MPDVSRSEAWPEGRWTYRPRLKLWMGHGDKRDYRPGLRVGRWWLHWERLAFSFDLWLVDSALWIEVFRYA